MSKIELLLLSFSVAVFVFCVVSLILVRSSRKYAEDNGEGTEELSVNGSTQLGGTTYEMSNLLDTIDWLGKNTAELGISEEYYQIKSGFLVIDVEGNLFNEPAKGSVYFSYIGDEESRFVETIYLDSRILIFDYCREQLIKEFGEPEHEWEEPYARVKGGAVTQCLFKKDGKTINLSKASERDYITITMSKQAE